MEGKRDPRTARGGSSELEPRSEEWGSREREEDPVGGGGWLMSESSILIAPSLAIAVRVAAVRHDVGHSVAQDTQVFLEDADSGGDVGKASDSPDRPRRGPS